VARFEKKSERTRKLKNELSKGMGNESANKKNL